MFYIASECPGETVFRSFTALDRWQYIFAYTDPVLALVRTMPDHEWGCGHEVLLDESEGRAVLWERLPNAFRRWYEGACCSLYEVGEEQYRSGLTGWGCEMVPVGDVPVLHEERIEDVYHALVSAREAGRCVMHEFEDSDDYHLLLGEAAGRIRARESQPIFILDDGVLKQFIARESLDEVSVPEGVHRIGYRAFSYAQVCRVRLPEGVTTLEEEAFYGSSLKSILIPDSVKCIERWAFGGCEELHAVAVPESVRRIEPCAFGFRRGSDYWTPVPNRRKTVLYSRPGSEAQHYTERGINASVTDFRENTVFGDLVMIAGRWFSMPDPVPDTEGSAVVFTEGTNPRTEWGLNADGSAFRRRWESTFQSSGQVLHRYRDWEILSPEQLCRAIDEAARLCRYSGFSDWADAYSALSLRIENTELSVLRECNPQNRFVSQPETGKEQKHE